MNRDLLEVLLQILVNKSFITTDNKNSFLKSFDARYISCQDILKKYLSYNANHDFNIIIQFIKSCKQNDILINLHHYLSTSHFNYLRENQINANDDKIFFGTDQTGSIIQTSYAWAMIEKAITLQMQMNIKNTCKWFNELFGEIKAEQFANNHSFFSIKHKGKSITTEKSSTFRAFQTGNVNEMERKYNKLFG